MKLKTSNEKQYQHKVSRKLQKKWADVFSSGRKREKEKNKKEKNKKEKTERKLGFLFGAKNDNFFRSAISWPLFLTLMNNTSSMKKKTPGGTILSVLSWKLFPWLFLRLKIYSWSFLFLGPLQKLQRLAKHGRYLLMISLLLELKWRKINDLSLEFFLLVLFSVGIT